MTNSKICLQTRIEQENKSSYFMDEVGELIHHSERVSEYAECLAWGEGHNKIVLLDRNCDDALEIAEFSKKNRGEHNSILYNKYTCNLCSVCFPPILPLTRP